MATTAGSSSSRSSMERSGEWSGERSTCSSPIPYRHSPYAYTPAVNCYCGRKTPRWISWSVRNPGRRYHSCYKYRDGGCGFWMWLDPKPTDHQIEVLNDLRDAVEDLRNKNKTLEMEKNQLSFLLDEAHVKHAQLVEEKQEANLLVKELEMKALAKEQEAKELHAKVQVVAVVRKGAKACCCSAILVALVLGFLMAMFNKDPEPLKLQLL